MDSAVTGFHKPVKPTSFLGRFLTCKAQPCVIDHWPYIGQKCFYRSNFVKDMVGHNGSIWTQISDAWQYSPDFDFPCPIHICRHHWHQELNHTRQIVLRAMQQHFKNDTPWDIHNMYTGNKFVRINPYFGLEYVFNGFLTVSKNASDHHPQSVENRTATVTVRRGFTGKYCDVSVNSQVPSSEEPVYVIVPFSGRIDQLRLFYTNIKELLDVGISLRVIIATYGGPVHILGASELLRDMQLGFTEGLLTEGHIVQVVDAPGDFINGNFSRSLALLAGSLFVPSEALLFFCDVDMIIKPKFFANCRHNTMRAHKAYFPVVYSLYPYGKTVSKEHGYWRKGAYGMVCIFKSDFMKSKAWRNNIVQSQLTGWGIEDVLLFKDLMQGWRISIFQAIEPNLLHRWHPKYCSFNMNIAACLGTVLDNMGSQRFLASIVASTGVDVRLQPYTPQPVIFDDFKNDTAGSAQRMFEMPAAEGETTSTKIAAMKAMYEEQIHSGKAGVLSAFAKDALDQLNIRNNQESQEHARREGTDVHADSLPESNNEQTTPTNAQPRTESIDTQRGSNDAKMVSETTENTQPGVQNSQTEANNARAQTNGSQPESIEYESKHQSPHTTDTESSDNRVHTTTIQTDTGDNEQQHESDRKLKSDGEDIQGGAS